MRSRVLVLLPLVLACDGPVRVRMEPASLRFGVRGRTARVRATPVSSKGERIEGRSCRWSSSDDRVATVSGRENDVTVTAAGPGSAVVRCTVGKATGEVQVLVRVVGKVTLETPRADLEVADQPRPLPLEVAVLDDTGAPAQGRVVLARCAREDVCRGDATGRLWAVAAGDTTALVEVEGVRSAEIPVHVVDARRAGSTARASDVKRRPASRPPRKPARR